MKNQKSAGIYKLFEYASIFEYVQNLLGMNNNRRIWVDEYIKPKTGCSILDLGCGPCKIIDFLPSVKYTGIDINKNNIEYAKRMYADNTNLIVKDISDVELVHEDKFDIVISHSLLHHIDDVLAKKVFEIANLNLKKGGKFITADPCYYDKTKFFAKLINKLDRGNYVRVSSEYLDLAKSVFSKVDYVIREDLGSIPTCFLIMTCQNNSE